MNVEVVEYEGYSHDIGEFITEQHAAVAGGDCQMLPIPLEEGKIRYDHNLPFFIASAGGTAVAGAGFNTQYPDGSTELGGAYVCKRYRGRGLYHRLTQARIAYAQSMEFPLISFANSNSYPILTADFGFTPVQADTAPAEAFDLCVDCNSNPNPGCSASFQTCCDRETILYLPESTVE